MMRYLKTGMLVFAIYAGFAMHAGFAMAQTGRGELLYSTYCNACHA